MIDRQQVVLNTILPLITMLTAYGFYYFGIHWYYLAIMFGFILSGFDCSAYDSVGELLIASTLWPTLVVLYCWDYIKRGV